MSSAGWGAALQDIGNSLMNYGMNQMAIKQKRADQAAADDREQRLMVKRLQLEAALGIPQERSKQVRDEQTQKAMIVHQQWQPPELDDTGNVTKPGSWIDTSREEVVPKSTFEPTLGGVYTEGQGFKADPEAQKAIIAQRLASRTPAAAGPAPDKAANWRIEDTDQGKMRVNILTGEVEPLAAGGKPLMQAGKGTSGLSPQDKKQVFAANQKLASIDALEEQLNNVEGHFEKLKGTWSAGPGGGLIPGAANADAEQFDKSVALLSPLMRQLTRVPGEGAQSDYEAKLMEMANLKRGSREATTEGQIKEMRQLLNNMRAGHQMTLESYGMEYKKPGAKEAPKVDKSGGAGSSAQNPVDITSEAEADSLPPGTFVRLNGRVGKT